MTSDGCFQYLSLTCGVRGWDNKYVVNAERQERLLAILDKHVYLSLSVPLLISAFLIIVYYLGGSDLRRLIDFVTFSK